MTLERDLSDRPPASARRHRPPAPASGPRPQRRLSRSILPTVQIAAARDEFRLRCRKHTDPGLLPPRPLPAQVRREMLTSLRRPVETQRAGPGFRSQRQASFHAEKRGAVTEGRGERWIGAGAAGRSVVPLDAPLCVFDKALIANSVDRSTRLRDTLFMATEFRAGVTATSHGLGWPAAAFFQHGESAENTVITERKCGPRRRVLHHVAA